jgi:hypothetical protein
MAEVDERPRHAGCASDDGEDEEPGDEEDEDVGGPHPGVHEPLRVLVQIRRRHRLRVQLRHLLARLRLGVSSSAAAARGEGRVWAGRAGGGAICEWPCVRRGWSEQGTAKVRSKMGAKKKCEAGGDRRGEGERTGKKGTPPRW